MVRNGERNIHMITLCNEASEVAGVVIGLKAYFRLHSPMSSSMFTQAETLCVVSCCKQTQGAGLWAGS